MIPFLDLKEVNAKYKEELLNACQVIDSGWYIREMNVISLNMNLLSTRQQICNGGAEVNGLDALILILRAYKELTIKRW